MAIPIHCLCCSKVGRSPLRSGSETRSRIKSPLGTRAQSSSSSKRYTCNQLETLVGSLITDWYENCCRYIRSVYLRRRSAMWDLKWSRSTRSHLSTRKVSRLFAETAVLPLRRCWKPYSSEIRYPWLGSREAYA
jgi:hypothetical protein